MLSCKKGAINASTCTMTRMVPSQPTIPHSHPPLLNEWVMVGCEGGNPTHCASWHMCCLPFCTTAPLTAILSTKDQISAHRRNSLGWQPVLRPRKHNSLEWRAGPELFVIIIHVVVLVIPVVIIQLNAVPMTIISATIFAIITTILVIINLITVTNSMVITRMIAPMFIFIMVIILIAATTVIATIMIRIISRTIIIKVKS